MVVNVYLPHFHPQEGWVSSHAYRVQRREYRVYRREYRVELERYIAPTWSMLLWILALPVMDTGTAWT
jgi:hypothetical protein